MDDELLNNRVQKKELGTIERFKFQSALVKKFGDEGLRAYMKMGAKKTVKQVLDETGLAEDKLLAILDFMDSQGAVKFEKPFKREQTAPEVTPEKPQEKPEERGEAKSEEIMSPLEKTIFDKFGKVGVEVYNLIDGEKTAEEILKETGISESKLVEILEFMDEEGIIKLERPGAGAGGEREGEPEEIASPFAGPAAPLHDESPIPIDGEIRIIAVDVPIRRDIGIFKKAAVEAELLAKFQNDGRKLWKAIDNKRNTARIARETGLSLQRIDTILAFLVDKGAALVEPMTPDEIKREYGAEGMTIYNRFGRNGILMYELIDKRATIRDVLLASKLEPEKAVDIFLFIHKVLGIDLPIEKETLYRQLGVRPPPAPSTS
ncbi:MAG: hypothetical protein AB1468_04240 [Candidatus Micrarchaeota archaeon]